VRELVLDPETFKRRPVIWAYTFDATSRTLTLITKGATTRPYRLERDSSEMLYELTNSDAGEVGYDNEPDDCSI
jgi:hypothetical protein